MPLTQIAPGLRRWTTPHAEWLEEVGSLAVDTDDGLVLIDPLDPPAEVGEPAHVLLTVHWHVRSSGAGQVWAHQRASRLLANRGVELSHPFIPGDPLPGGIEAITTSRPGEVIYWLPQQRSLAIGDVLLGAGAKPHATNDPLRLCPERWLGKATHDDLRASLSPLLDLPVENVLVSHGEPVIRGGADMLAALLGG